MLPTQLAATPGDSESVPAGPRRARHSARPGGQHRQGKAGTGAGVVGVGGGRVGRVIGKSGSGAGLIVQVASG